MRISPTVNHIRKFKAIPDQKGESRAIPNNSVVNFFKAGYDILPNMTTIILNLTIETIQTLEVPKILVWSTLNTNDTRMLKKDPSYFSK